MNAHLPASVRPFAGKIIDVDTHEMMPAQAWVENFGDIAKRWADMITVRPPGNAGNNFNLQDYAGDLADVDPETIWTVKGCAAPGATDVARRLDVMDTMTVDRQLMFPSGIGLLGVRLYTAARGTRWFDLFKDDSQAYGEELLAANNEWAVRAAAHSPRVRPVTPVVGATPEILYDRVKALIDRGIRAIQLPASRPPGGVSPASNELDRFYAMLAEANIALTLHIGGDQDDFFRSNDWNRAKAFEGFMVSAETSQDPWTLAVQFMAPQNFLTAMITGGVFDRHPTLRVGAIEYAAHWIGPMASGLDLWHDNNQSKEPAMFANGSSGRRLPMRPSEYIARNVRVNPFPFEPVGEYIAKHGLEDVYCFSTDYPHVEGGKNAVDRFCASLEPLGPRVMEKFFVKNGELLLPD